MPVECQAVLIAVLSKSFILVHLTGFLAVHVRLVE